MNIGSSYYTASLSRQFSQLQDAQAKAQGMIATGKKFIEASDNPNAALETQRLSLARIDLAGESNRRNLASRLSESALLSAQKSEEFIKVAVTSIGKGYATKFDDAEMALMKNDVDNSIEQAVGLLNLEIGGRHLFGGNQSFGNVDAGEEAAPFQLIDVDGDGSYDRVEYHGSAENMAFDIGLDVRLDPTADASLNHSWAEWMTGILVAKNELAEGDRTLSKAALDAAEIPAQSARLTTFDLIGKSLRIDTIEEWANKADTNFANREAALQEADVNAVVLQFNELQRNYQASLQSGRMLLSLSLVDFI